ncbi:MAG TPA: alpha/beta hydrolase [Microscillaceae bacterium]|jgi:proline iminopeptidase|nr:alpha/beta hydrolase [Microscillaceae bacterium]
MQTSYLYCLLFSLGYLYNLWFTQDFVVNYRTFGQGKPVVIINGGPGMNSDGFAGIAQEIAALNYQTIIFDQRGTGKSIIEPIDASTITIDRMVEDLEVLRKKLGFEKWTVMGHSFGGILATHYAALYPERIEKIIFSSSGGLTLKFSEYVGNRIQTLLTAEQRDSLAYYQEKLNKGENTAYNLQKRASLLANAYVYDKNHAPAIAERLLQVNFTINGLVFQNLQAIGYNYTGKFHAFAQPVLVLQGQNDIIAVETAQEIAQNFPNASLVLLDNCGHYGWLDQREEYLEAVKNFLSK